MRIFRVPNQSHYHKGRTVLGFEAGEVPAWIPPEREEGERDEELRRLVDLLRKPDRDVVSAVYFGQATMREAAQAAGVSSGSAQTCLKRGLRQLEDWLTGRDAPPGEDPPLDPDLEPRWVDDPPELSESEVRMMLYGRYRGDGRRLDQFYTGEPCAWTPE